MATPTLALEGIDPSNNQSCQDVIHAERRGGPMQFNFIECRREGDIAVLMVNDPPANTLTYDLVRQLEDTYFELMWDPQIKALIITGAGERFFSGGVNIGMLCNVSHHYNSNFILYAAEVFDRIEKSPLLVVTAINGHITGGGLELALIADKRIAVEGDYNFGFPEVRLGVIPGLGGTQRLLRMVGPHAALELITQGRFISAARAKELDIIHAVFPKEDFIAQAVAYTHAVLQEAAPVKRSLSGGHSQWQAPDPTIICYSLRGGIGVITITEGCSQVSALQALWALNQALLEARLDEAAEAIVLVHEGPNLHLGRDDEISPALWEYADFVFTRLENTARLCVLAFTGRLDALASELAWACDYRLVPEDEQDQEDFILVSKRSRGWGRYRFNGACSDKKTLCLSRKQVEQTGLVKAENNRQWPQAALQWLSHFVSPQGASKSIGYAKLAVVKGSTLPLEAGMLLERHLQEQLFRSHDGTEGMKAYLEKRAAVFTGE